MASEITMETLNYRLEQLEKSVSELKSLLVDSKLQDKDIKSLNERVGNLETRVSKLEKAPAETKASWFDKGLDIVFKLAITAIVGIVLAKIGLGV
jgi:predicted RNase H-like nuclease (RuvC/YqgF family)